MNHNFTMVNADTDSISFKKPDDSPFTEEEQKFLLNEINLLMPEMIEYEDDGYYEKIIVLKAKNYILKKYGEAKYTIKGSALKDQKKEPALTEFIGKIIDDLLATKGKNLTSIYDSYILEVMNINDITRWCTKKNISKAIMEAGRSNEQKVLDALDDSIREGDKVYLFSAIEGLVVETKNVTKNWHTPLDKNLKPKMIPNRVLRLAKHYNKNVDTTHYLKRVHATLKVFSNILDMKQFVKYDLSGSKSKLTKLMESANA